MTSTRTQSHRGYTLIDFEPPRWLCGDLDLMVRFMAHVRANFHRIVAGVPPECEADLFASGDAHNPGVILPWLGLFAPGEVIDRLPHWGFMIEAVSDWCASLSEQEVRSIASATSAPTWDELQRLGVYPIRGPEA